jgi:23S rRNA (pseudouridine1915-N3)-methyltransferase
LARVEGLLKIVLLAVGAPKAAALGTAIRDYETRIKRYFRFESREIRPQRISPDVDVTALIERESRELLAKVPDGLEVVAVDQRGLAWSSEQLAGYLQAHAVQGRPGVAFLIGGPLGISESLRSGASRVMSLSPFTLPHELARLVLVEQIYRAGTINRGEPYHKGG